MQTNQMKFSQICEAHDVLSNGKFPRVKSDPFPLPVQKKAIYDIYGEYGLKEGCVTPQGGKCPRWKTNLCCRENRRRLLLAQRTGEVL
jgi:DnaJ-class molecular chaperone